MYLPFNVRKKYTVILNLVSLILPIGRSIRIHPFFKIYGYVEISPHLNTITPPPQSQQSCDWHMLLQKCPTWYSCYNLRNILCQARNPCRPLEFWVSNHTWPLRFKLIYFWQKKMYCLKRIGLERVIIRTCNTSWTSDMSYKTKCLWAKCKWFRNIWIEFPLGSLKCKRI